MPAVSKAQQKAAGAALSAKRKETKVSELKGAAKSAAIVPCACNIVLFPCDFRLPSKMDAP